MSISGPIARYQGRTSNLNWSSLREGEKEPLSFLCRPRKAAGQIVHGLEKELAGLKVGDQKKVRVKPEEGYGLPDPKAFQEIPKEKIPPDSQKTGAMLMTKSPRDQTMAIRVHEVKDKTVVVDLNHPLAGNTLNFDVKATDSQVRGDKITSASL